MTLRLSCICSRCHGFESRSSLLFKLLICDDLPDFRSQGGLEVINRTSHLCDPGSTLARVVCGLSFSRSQSDSEGFSPGTLVFLPPQNRLLAYSIRLWSCAPRSYMGRVRQHNSFGPTSLSCPLSNSVSDCEKGRLAGQILCIPRFRYMENVHMLLKSWELFVRCQKSRVDFIR